MNLARRHLLSGFGAAILAKAASGSGLGGEIVISHEEAPTQTALLRSEDGVGIPAQIYGPDAPTGFVFIHGLGQCHLSWSNQVSALKHQYRVATYDLRGHGDASKPLESRFYSEGWRWASDLRMVIQASGIKRPIVVGWSLGGVILSHYLKHFGSRGLGGFVLAGAVTSFNPDYFEPETKEVLDLLCSRNLLSHLEGVRRFVDDCFAVRLEPSLRDRTIAFNAMVPAEVHEAIRALTLDGTEGVWAGLQVPCLVVHGAKDRLVRVEMSKHSAWEIPRSELKIYDGASHGPMVDAFREFNADLLRFATKTIGPQ